MLYANFIHIFYMGKYELEDINIDFSYLLLSFMLVIKTMTKKAEKVRLKTVNFLSFLKYVLFKNFYIF